MRLLRSVLHLSLVASVLVGIVAVPGAAAAPRHAPTQADSPFGIVANLANRVRTDEHAAMAGLMQEAGMRWSREELSWDKIQLERGGPFRWEGDPNGIYNYDSAVAVQHAAGINVLGLLAYNPAWFKGKNPTLDEWIGDWGNYVYNVVARYGRERKQIRYWEVWNEANFRPFGYEHGLYTVKEFVRILDVSRAAIKAADPEAVVVLGGLLDFWGQLPTPEDYDSFDYLRMIHAAGGWNAFDILALHPYRGAAPETVLDRRGPDMSMQDELHALDALMSPFGRKPVWLTEMGWSSAQERSGVSEADQAAYLQRLYILALAHPIVEKVFWYDLRDDTAPAAPYNRPVYDPVEEQYHFGLLRRRFPLDPDAPDLRKPAYLAFRALSDTLAGLRLEAVVADGANPTVPQIYWYRFGDGVRRVDIVWRLGGNPVDIEIRCDCREARVRLWDGRLSKVTTASNGVVVGRLEELGLPIMVETGPDKSTQGTHYPQTDHYLDGEFARYWREHGGLEQFGYPITGELIVPDPSTGKARRVQYFERNRFDYFPELADTSFVVQLGRLGDIALRLAGVDWEKLPRRETGDEPCLFFGQTGHQICPPFRKRWEEAGGLDRHGLPLTDAFSESGRVVQYFERSRFEAHPQNKAPFDIQLGLLSRELYSSWGRWR